MKCSCCIALRSEGYEYPEEYCGIGIPDNETVEFKDGECGCNTHYMTIRKRLKEADEAFCAQYQDCGEWFKEKEYKERTGIDVSDPNGPHVLQAIHCVGLDHSKPYTRHKKKFYKAYRNYFNIHHDDPVWRAMVDIGHAEESSREMFHLTEEGLRWLGRILDVNITEDK